MMSLRVFTLEKLKKIVFEVRILSEGLLCLVILNLFGFYATALGMLAGGRPNAISEGTNAFAGVVNPANAVWIPNRFDIGAFWVYQKSSLNNRDNNRFFPPGKIDLTHRSRNIVTADIAIHKHVKLEVCSMAIDSSFTLAAYTLPTYIKLRTKTPFPITGTTPIKILDRTDVISAIFSVKLNPSFSIGLSIDYLYFSHLRNGFQNSDNPIRSASPGHVTNNGTDHSNGIGLGIGCRWNITKKLNLGAVWIKKSYCGQYRKYRGYEPHHAENFVPQTAGAGFSYRFTSRVAGRLEVIWVDLGNLPNSNNNILSNGRLNLNRRGSKKSPGPGLQDATFINIGIGYKVNSMLSVGASFSHRIKLHKSSNILSHTYTLQTIYNILALGANFSCRKHDFFLAFSYGFKNRVSGLMPLEVGGGRFIGEKQNISLSVSWGYKY